MLVISGFGMVGCVVSVVIIGVSVVGAGAGCAALVLAASSASMFSWMTCMRMPSGTQLSSIDGSMHPASIFLLILCQCVLTARGMVCGVGSCDRFMSVQQVVYGDQSIFCGV